jgi:bisphosphoglycerate-dependent phosphoglycerate mutase
MESKADQPLGEHLEEDVKRVIAYLNDHVVPEVRENSSKALRIAAEQLSRLAAHLERRQGE